MVGFLGYEPVPGQPSALSFKKPDGQSVLAFGPEAMALKQQIDASDAGRTFADNAGGAAGYGPPPPPAQHDYAAEFGAAPPPGPMGPPQGPAPAAPQSPPQAGRPGAPSPTGNLADYLGAPVYTPGRRGVSREQLQTRATQGVATPTTIQAGQEGGFTPDDDYTEGVKNLSVDERLQHQQVADAQSEEQQRFSNAAYDQFETLSAQKAAEAAHADKLAAGIRQDEQALAQARHAFATAKVDPGRIYHGSSGGLTTIAHIVAAGLGAYAATIGHAPNFAQQTIDNQIERDIRAQEGEIRTKGETANNALADLTRHTGNMEMAKSALRVVQADTAQRQLMAFAADSKSKEIQQAAADWNIQAQRSLADKMEDYRQKSLGKRTQEIHNEVAYPKAATAGGYRAPTDAEVERRATTAGKVAGVAATQATTAKTEAETTGVPAEIELKRAQAEKAKNEASTGPVDPGANDFKKSVTAIANNRTQIESIASKYGFQVKDGKIVGDGSYPTRAQFGKSAGLDAELTSLGVTFSSIANNDAELGEAAKAKLTPSPGDSDAAINAKLQAQLDYINNKESAIKSTAAPSTRGAVERNRASNGAEARRRAESAANEPTGKPLYGQE